MKKLSVLFICLILVSMLLASCKASLCATLVTGGEGGTYYSIGEALSELLSSNEDEDGEKDKTKFTGSFNVVSSSGYAENIEKLADGYAQLAIVRNDIAYYAQNGTLLYEGQKQEKLSLVLELYNEAIHIIAKTGTNDIYGLSGKKICVGEEGSASEIAVKAVLAEAGVTDYTAVNLSNENAEIAFINGEIDAYIFVSGIKSRTVTDLAKKFTFEMIGIPDDVVERICKKYPFFEPYTVSKKTYSVLKSAVHTVTLRACLMTSTDVDKTLIYNIAKRFSEDGDLLNHSKYSELKADNMWTSCLTLHPGAEKRMKEYDRSKDED